MSELRETLRGCRPFRVFVLNPFLVLQGKLRVGQLASTVSVFVPGVHSAHDLERIPHFIRVREVPAPDAGEAESGMRYTSVASGLCPPAGFGYAAFQTHEC